MNEGFAGKKCPYCHGGFSEEDIVVVCSICDMPHHKECWIENKACTTFGCTGTITFPNGQKAEAAIEIEEQPAVFCSKCGAKGKPAALFCNKCGSPLRRTTKQIRQPEKTVTVPVETQKPLDRPTAQETIRSTPPAPVPVKPVIMPTAPPMPQAQPTIKFCTACGAKNPGDNLFCGKCGNRLR